MMKTKTKFLLILGISFLLSSKLEAQSYLKAFKKGFNAYEMGDTNKAYDLFAKSYSKNNTFAPALFNLGLIHYKRNQLDQAFFYFDKLVGIDSTFEDVLYKRGLVNLSKKNLEAAYQDFNSQLNVQPNNHRALLMRGITLAEMGKYQESLDDLNEVKTIDQEVKPDLLAYKAMDKYNLGDVEGALKDINVVFGIDSSISIAHSILGSYYFSKRDAYKSMYHYETSIKLGDDNANNMNNLALCYIETGHYLKAETLLNNGLKSYPEYREFYHNLGFLFSKRFEVERTQKAFLQAESNFRKSISFESPLEMSFQNLAVVYFMNQQPDSVISVCKAGLKRYPENMYFVKALTECYFKMDQDDKAISFLDQYIGEHPDYKDLFYIKGNFLRMASKFDEAAIWYKNKAMERGNDIPFNHEMADTLFLFAAYEFSNMCLDNILNQSPQDTLAMIKMLRNLTLEGKKLSNSGKVNQKTLSKLAIRAENDALAHLYTCLYWMIQGNIDFDLILSSFNEVKYPNKQYNEYILKGINARLQKSDKSEYCRFFTQALASGSIDARFFYFGGACNVK